MHHVPGQLDLAVAQLPLGVFEREPQLRDQGLEPLVPGDRQEGLVARCPDERLDRPQLEDLVDGDEPAVEGDSHDGDTVDVAHRADAGVAAVGLVRVEADGHRLEAVADGGDQLLRTFERIAVLGDVEHGAAPLPAGRREGHLGAQRREVRGAVPLRAEEDLPALAPFELFVVADAVQWNGHWFSSAGWRRTRTARRLAADRGPRFPLDENR